MSYIIFTFLFMYSQKGTKNDLIIKTQHNWYTREKYNKNN